MNSWLPPAPDASSDDAAQAWFLRLRSGAATDADVDSWQTWMASSEANRSAYARAGQVWDDIEPFGPAMARRFDQTRERVGFVQWLRQPVLACMAAAAIVGLWVVPQVAMWNADHHTPVGQTLRTSLPDGTTAWLDTDSVLKLRFSGQERGVELVRGQIWFDVREGDARPFVVRARDGTITDIGTFFGVRLDGDETKVGVLRGAVSVSRGSSVLTIGAGQGARFGRDSSHVASATFAADEIAWQSGRLDFTGQPLAAVLKEIDRYWPGRIVLLASDASRNPITAMLTLDNLSAGLDALARTQGLEVTRLTDYLVIVAR